jgi:hypothetical protein
MRLAGKMKLGFYPLPLNEAERIGKCLVLPAGGFSALDPCVGDGRAFEVMMAASAARRYGIELDAYRAEQAKTRIDTVIQGDCLQVHCPSETISLLYLNPPYDFELTEGESKRTEQGFLDHTYRWIKPGGLLIFVIPAERIDDCARTVASQFRDIRIYRLGELECVRYRQVVIFGVKRGRRERNRLQEAEVRETLTYLSELTRDASGTNPLTDDPDFRYVVPESEPVELVSRGLPLDEIEDLLTKSPAYRQVNRILFGNQATISGRPLTPLHGGHVGLLCTAGMLNGIFGAAEDRHLACWQSIKVTDHIEETEEDGTVTIRDRERFTQRLTLIYADGRTAVLS